MGYTNIDIDLLRTLEVACDLGAFVKAATRLGRSQSALSLQMKKLEELIGRPLFRKDGRRLVPTEAGELLLGYARRILALNDEALCAARGVAKTGAIRLGLPDELAGPWLSGLLRRFHRDYPDRQILAHIGQEDDLAAKLAGGAIDMALSFADGGRGSGEVIGSCRLAWFAGGDDRPPGGGLLPLVALEGRCLFRRRATALLDEAGMAWRLALASPSLAGLWSAVGAGIGVTLRALGPAGTAGETIFPVADGLPLPGAVALVLSGRGGGDAPSSRLRSLLAEQAAAGLPCLTRPAGSRP